ncbi:MAG: peptidase E [Chloroflexi bacterium]|nr:peptidase E [Chloroflexota bacterium]
MGATAQRILAIGGSSVMSNSTDWPLHQFLLDLSGRDRPRICFLGTASGDDASYRAGFYATFARHAEASHLDLFGRTVDDVGSFLLEQDVIFVGGGNTANMLAIWRLHGVDKALKAAWEEGVVLAGPSAGGICWFEAGLTDSFGPGLAPLRDGLKFLPGSFCPHYDSESLRRPRYEETVGSGALPDGFAADDSVGILFNGRELEEVVAAMPGQHAYRVERRKGTSVEETQIRARLLR